MIAEEQIPGPFLRLDPLALEGRRQVEHHDILIMMGKNARKVMPADSISPSFDERSDLSLGRFGWLRHSFHLECLLTCIPRTNVGAHIRHAIRHFMLSDREFVIEQLEHYIRAGR